MGVGKTSAAIHLMNNCPDHKFIFITPFLEEIKRIKESCPSLKITEPSYNRKHNKFTNFKELIEQGRNIASTHALFQKCDSYVESLIHEKGYTLILDEVCDVITVLDIAPDDLRLFIKAKAVNVDQDGRVYWSDEDYRRGWGLDVMRDIKSGHVIMENGQLLIWRFPYKAFEAFQETYVLTYKFAAQAQKYYFDMCGLSYEYIGARKSGDHYEFCEADEMQPLTLDLATKIHIIEDESVNVIGEDWNALSSSWFERMDLVSGKPKIKELKQNAENVVRHKWNVKSESILWSTHMRQQGKMAGKGYSRGFLSFNYRATNTYRNKTHLMYLINVYSVVDIKNFFLSNGIVMDDDGYATSIMIQWIWRSAIRDGNDIWLYLPSKRMRHLLTKWISEVSNG